VKFQGLLIARAFGRNILERMANSERGFHTLPCWRTFVRLGRRFISHKHMITCRIEEFLFAAELTRSPSSSKFTAKHANTWTGTGSNALFLCPAIGDNGHYNGSIWALSVILASSHVIFGSQIDLSTIGGSSYLSDDALVDLTYDSGFIYSSSEPRHLHTLR